MFATASSYLSRGNREGKPEDKVLGQQEVVRSSSRSGDVSKPCDVDGWIGMPERQTQTHGSIYSSLFFLYGVDVDGTLSFCTGRPTRTRRRTASSLTHRPIPYTSVPSIVVQVFDASSSFRDRVEQNPRFRRPLGHLRVRFCAKRHSASYLLRAPFRYFQRATKDPWSFD